MNESHPHCHDEQIQPCLEEFHYDYQQAPLLLQISNNETFTELSISMKFIAGTCTELPQGGNLITDSVFPVKKGTDVFVNCVEGFTLTSGDRTLTCLQDSDYTASRKLPTCSIGMFFMTM